MVNGSLNIAICDDNENIVNEVYDFCINRLKFEDFDVDIKKFDSGITLLNINADFDILFLDIEMPDISGMDVARKIRERNKYTKIVFFTSHEEFMQEAFEVSAYRYLKKPFDETKFIEVLDKIMDEFFMQRILFEDKTRSIYVNIRDIYYMEPIYVDESKIYFKNNGEDDVITIRKTLKYWEKRYPGIFYRCHKQTLVNLFNVKEYIGKKIVLTNGAEVELSTRTVRKFPNIMADFIKKYGSRL